MQITHLLIRFFFFNHTSTTEIYTLSLHDALPISDFFDGTAPFLNPADARSDDQRLTERMNVDRKSTRLNSSHMSISYAVFCLKKKIICAALRPLMNVVMIGIFVSCFVILHLRPVP